MFARTESFSISRSFYLEGTLTGPSTTLWLNVALYDGDEEVPFMLVRSHYEGHSSPYKETSVTDTVEDYMDTFTDETEAYINFEEQCKSALDFQEEWIQTIRGLGKDIA